MADVPSNELTLTNNDWAVLNYIARAAIERYPDRDWALPTVSAQLSETHNVFVGLYQSGKCRGCHGIYDTSLYQGIREAAIAAAYEDEQALRIDKKQDVEVELSILMPFEKCRFEDHDLLKSHFREKKPGVRIYHERSQKEAIFLPQVWREYADPDLFLSKLCIKAGLDYLAWITHRLEISTFKTLIYRSAAAAMNT